MPVSSCRSALVMMSHLLPPQLHCWQCHMDANSPQVRKAACPLHVPCAVPWAQLLGVFVGSNQSRLGWHCAAFVAGCYL